MTYLDEKGPSIGELAFALPIAAFLGGLVLYVGIAMTDNPPRNNASVCKGVRFIEEKAARGTVTFGLDPDISSRYTIDGISGSVISGNDTGEDITPESVYHHTIGEIVVTYPSDATDVQHSTVRADLLVSGLAQVQVCPTETIYINPVSTTHVSNK